MKISKDLVLAWSLGFIGVYIVYWLVTTLAVGWYEIFKDM